MAQPFCQSKAYRDLPQSHFFNMSEEKAYEEFVRLRWGSLTKMPCPVCGTVDEHYPRRTRKQWRCKHCDATFSATTGTPFSNRKLPFKMLLMIAYEFVTSPKGCAANALHAKLGLTLKTVFRNLGKLREALYQQRDLTPLSGLVQVDGGHFCGKPRRPRKRQKATSAIVNHRLRNRKAGIIPGGSGGTLEPWNKVKLENRRVVITLRQISPIPGRGAERTITAIVLAENANQVLPVIQKYVVPGAIIHSDNGHAYSRLSMHGYLHDMVTHSVEYSTDQGVNNNQAESFFGRMRRAEYGTYHGMRPQYLGFYSNEIAWREDMRRSPLGTKFKDLMEKVFRCGISTAWCGYAQGKRLVVEYLG